MKLTALFDMDGVIIDSVNMSWEIYNALLEEYLVYVPDEYLQRYVGHSIDDQLSMIEQDFKVVINHDEFKAQAEALRPAYYENLGTRSGLIALLDELKANGVTMAVVTVQTTQIANINLAKLGIAEYFSLVVAAENVTYPKPNPEPYLTAAKSLGVEPGSCVAFEDAPTGIQSAKLAGMKVIAMEQPYLSEIEAAKANLSITTFSDVNFAKLSALVG